MPITKGAKKTHRASLRKRVFNLRRLRSMNEVIKDLRSQSIGDKTEAEKLLPKAYQAIDKAAKRGIIKKTPLPEKNQDWHNYLNNQAPVV